MSNPLLDSDYAPLPSTAVDLLRRTSAPPRLVAHLVVVHDVASTLVARIAEAFPELTFDPAAVLFGAATHDLGKSIEDAELAQPGKEHEKCGLEMLLEMGVPKDRARFAYTHGNWDTAPEITIDDLLVALADNCWKGKRVDELESRTVELLSAASGKPAWDCYAALDEILATLSADADARLAWQGAFGTQRAAGG